MTGRPPGGARLMLGFHGQQPTDEWRRVLEATQARSVIFFARNLVDAAQASQLVAATRALVPWPLLVAIDQEGGAVCRIVRGATVFPGNMALGAADDVELARAQGRASGRQLAALGIDLNLAPVVDLQTNPRNPGIGIRSLGAERARAVPLARALIEGHAEHGVASCLKHFPGKGAAGVDAHLDLPVLDLPLRELRDPHLAIFADLVRATPGLAVMTTHVVARALDALRPATLSRAVAHDLLRGELGFEGLLLADDLEMGAIVRHHGIATAAVAAAAAGHDVLPICHDAEQQLGAARALEAALDDGRLDRGEHAAALGRIEALAGRAPGGGPVDPSDGDAVARAIAERAVHCFADQRRLLPLSKASDVLVLAASPHAVVGVEEAAERDWPGLVRGCFLSAGLDRSVVRAFATDLDAAAAEALVALAASHQRVVLLTWNALGLPGMRGLLALACQRLADRLIVVHLRNPFDQALVPPGVTALTPFGYRVVQLEALARVLAGRLAAQGRLPAPVR